MTQSSSPRRSRPTAFQKAAALYGAAFEAADINEVREAMHDFMHATQPTDQTFMICHLLYLNLQAQSHLWKTLLAMKETMQHIAGATYTIADEVVQPRLEAEYAARQDEEAQDAANLAEQISTDYGTDEPEFPLPDDLSEDGGLMEQLQRPDAHQSGPAPHRDAGELTAAVLPFVPTPSAASDEEPGTPVEVIEPMQPSSMPTTAPSKQASRSSGKSSGTRKGKKAQAGSPGGDAHVTE